MANSRGRSIDFVNPNREEMQAIFDRVGLASGNEPNRLQRCQRARDKLVVAGCLFTMFRPRWGDKSLAHALFHPAYTKAALQDAPILHDYETKAWLPEITTHLQAFARQPEAREIVCNGLVTYYRRIADVTRRLPDSDELWIPGYATAEGTYPLALTGAKEIRRIAVLPGTVYRDRGRVYLPMQQIARHVGWTIPGIETSEMRAAILKGFAAARNPERVVDPKTLFMAGYHMVHGTEQVPMLDCFSPSPRL